MKTRTLLYGSLLMLLGCAKGRSQPLPGPASEPGKAAPSPAAAVDPDAFVKRTLSIGQRLELEKASRMAATPPAEAVLQALGAEGLRLNPERQHMASPIGARYCVGTTSAAGDLALSVCEYETAEAANAGRDSSAKTFAMIKDREVLVSGTTTLTILQPSATPASADEVRRARSAFARL
jgi:hypothetical protein